MNYQELQEAKQTFRIHALEKDYKTVYKAPCSLNKSRPNE